MRVAGATICMHETEAAIPQTVMRGITPRGAGAPAGGTLRETIGVPSRYGAVPAPATQHRLGVDEICIGETEHRIVGVREGRVRAGLATSCHVRVLWRADSLLKVADVSDRLRLAVGEEEGRPVIRATGAALVPIDGLRT